MMFDAGYWWLTMDKSWLMYDLMLHPWCWQLPGWGLKLGWWMMMVDAGDDSCWLFVIDED